MYTGEPGIPGPLILFPVILIGLSLLVLGWSSRWLRLPDDLEPLVLAALSDTEALPSWELRKRSPLAERDVDVGMVIYVLERLRAKGLVVRWYEELDMPGPKQTIQRARCEVYRRLVRDEACEASS